MAQVTQRPHLLHAMIALGLNQRQLGERLGVSARTIQRWRGSLRSAGRERQHYLARAVAPIDPDLAAEIALLAGTSPESLGLHGARRAFPGVSVLVDAMVCAASEAVALQPGLVRPALHAAFARCREVGLTLDEVEEALRPKGATTATRKG